MLTIVGSGFAPLPVTLLTEAPRIELPTVTLAAPDGKLFEVHGDDPTQNPQGVMIAWKSEGALEVTLSPAFVAAMPPGKYQVTVKNPNGRQGELPDGLEVVLGPRVMTVAPDTICPTVDQPVTVSGENFRKDARVALIGGGTTHVIPSARTTFDEVSGALKIVVAKDSLPIGDYDVQVTLAEGCSHTLAGALHMVPPPTLTSIAPQTVCTDIDTQVTLTGADFRQGASVSIGGAALDPADVTFVSATTIEITVRAGLAEGQHDVTVTNPEGCATTLPGALTVVPPPTLASVAPPTVCAGGTVTLTGTGFLAGASVTVGTVTLSGSAVTVSSATTITASIGPLTPGTYDVTVTNADGCASAVLPAALTVTPGPVIVAVDPTAVYNKVNFPIAIFGSGFKTGSSVTVGTQGITVLGVSAGGDRIDAVVPANTLPAGTYDLTVTDPAGCSYTMAGAVTVIDATTVTICGIDPPFGYNGEKTPVTITSGTGAGCSTGTQGFVSTPRAWLDVGGTLKALRSVAFVTDTSLTATVEAGLTVGGPYDLLVQNPDGQIGLLPQAFKVVDLPVPVIEAINPSEVDTQYASTLTITGKNFRHASGSPVTVHLISLAGTQTALTVQGTPTDTEIVVDLNVASLMLSTGAYVVRVTNTDQGTFSDFSALAITNPAGNLPGPWSTGTAMQTARRRHALVAGRVSSAARFLYAIGGSSDGATPALDTVELVPLDKFGNLGPQWTVQRFKLTAPRLGHGAVVRGRFIYVIGGENDTGVLKSVERAAILDPAEAPEVTTFSFTLGGTLTKGAWYYRVSATLPATDPLNPGGETLCSDPVVIQAIDTARVALTWKPLAGVASYNIYRTPAVNGTSGGEQLLADGLLPATVCTATECTYEDPGGTIKNPSQTPLPLGATGVFVAQGIPELGTPRSGAGVALARETSTIYVVGGRSATPTPTFEGTIEAATLSAEGEILSSWTTYPNPDPTGNPARERMLVAIGEHPTSPLVTANNGYLYLAGGSHTDVVKDGGVLPLAAGSLLTSFSPLAAFKQMPVAAVGQMVNDTFYYFGGSADGSTAIATSKSCAMTAAGNPALDNCNGLGTGAIPAPRMNAGLALESAYFYIAGGGTNDGAASKDVLKIIY